MKGFDGRCLNCGGVYVMWVHWSEQEGNVTDYAIAAGCRTCPDNNLYRLERELSGLSDHEYWGPDE